MDQPNPMNPNQQYQDPSLYNKNPQMPHNFGGMPIMNQQEQIKQEYQHNQDPNFHQQQYQIQQQQAWQHDKHDADMNNQQNQFTSPAGINQMQRPGPPQQENLGDERVVTTSLLHKNPPIQTPKLPNINQIQNKPGPPQGQQNFGGIQRPQNNIQGQSANPQMQQLLKNFFETIKKGDIDQVLAERQKFNIDIANLVDEVNFKQTPIFSAAVIKDENASLEMARIFTEMGVKPSQPDTLNQTPLYYASREGKNNLVDFLVKHGCDVNHLDTYGQTPFFYAVREGNLDTVKKLIEYGADSDIVDNNGQTPLYYAIKQNKIDVVDFLLKQGANINNQDKKGNTPTQWAKRFNKQPIIDLLVQHGAPPINDNKNQKNKKKVPPPQKPKINERKIPKRFMLTQLKDGYYEPLSEEEFTQFKQENPELAKYFEDEQAIESLPIPDVPESAQIYENWEKAAKRLLTNLWKHNNAWIFYEPVDAEKLGIPDYFDIVKQPMDLGTVKQRLSQNYYTRMQDFVNEVQLIFDNCILYNGESSQVSIMCKNVREEFHKLYESLYIDFYL